MYFLVVPEQSLNIFCTQVLHEIADRSLKEEQALQHLYDLVAGEEQRLGLFSIAGDDIERRVWRIMETGKSTIFSLNSLLNSYQQQYIGGTSAGQRDE